MTKILIKRGNVSSSNLDYGEFGFNQPNQRLLFKANNNTTYEVMLLKGNNQSVPFNSNNNLDFIKGNNATVLGWNESGNITAFNANNFINVVLNGKITTNLNMNSYRIEELGTPVNPTDAANKEYVDLMVSAGLTFHEMVNIFITSDAELTSFLNSFQTNYRAYVIPQNITQTNNYSFRGQIIEYKFINNGYVLLRTNVTKGDCFYFDNSDNKPSLEGGFYFIERYDTNNLPVISKLSLALKHANTHKVGGSDPLDVKDLVDTKNNLLQNVFNDENQLIISNKVGNNIQWGPINRNTLFEQVLGSGNLNSNIVLKLNAANEPTFRVRNIADPENLYDVANKKYVDFLNNYYGYVDEIINSSNFLSNLLTNYANYNNKKFYVDYSNDIKNNYENYIGVLLWVEQTSSGYRLNSLKLKEGSFFYFKNTYQSGSYSVGFYYIYIGVDNYNRIRNLVNMLPHANNHLSSGNDPIDVKDLRDTQNNLLKNNFTADGQLLIGTGPGTWTVLPKGQAGQVLTVKTQGATTLVRWENLPEFYTTFIQLTDTPNSYNGHKGKILIVNNNENGIEFTNVIDCGLIS